MESFDAPGRIFGAVARQQPEPKARRDLALARPGEFIALI
jgi:hypothetical protein